MLLGGFIILSLLELGTAVQTPESANRLVVGEKRAKSCIVGMEGRAVAGPVLEAPVVRAVAAQAPRLFFRPRGR